MASICIEDLREGAQILLHIAHITFCTVHARLHAGKGGREGEREGFIGWPLSVSRT